MRVAGAAPAGDSVSLVVIDVEGTEWSLVDTHATRKLTLGNHEESFSLRAFKDAFDTFVNSHGVDHVVIRRATYKGQKRSGAAAIKMEALLQLGGHATSLVASQSITKHFAALGIARPDSIMAYQSDAFATALFSLKE